MKMITRTAPLLLKRGYVVFSILLWIIMFYLLIDTMVSYKYESEKEVINLHTNPATDYIKQTIQVISLFLIYITINIIYIVVMGYLRSKNKKCSCQGMK